MPGRNEPHDVSWAQRIVRRYEAGERVPTVSVNAAAQVLGIRPGTLVRAGAGRGRFDWQAAAANDLDD